MDKEVLVERVYPIIQLICYIGAIAVLVLPRIVFIPLIILTILVTLIILYLEYRRCPAARWDHKTPMRFYENLRLYAPASGTLTRMNNRITNTTSVIIKGKDNEITELFLSGGTHKPILKPYSEVEEGDLIGYVSVRTVPQVLKALPINKE